MSLSTADREQFYLELSKLLAAGFPSGRAVETLLDHGMPKEQLRVVKRLNKRLQKRDDLATALKKALGSDARDLDISLVEAGQQGGRLPESLQQLSEHYGRTLRTTRTIRTQLVYPVILLHLGVLLPTLPKIISQPGSGALRNAFIILAAMWVVLLVLYLLLSAMSKSASGSLLLDSTLRRIPLYGAMRRHSAMSRFSDVFGFFLTAGLKVSTALRAAGKASASGVLNAAAKKAAKSIEAGNGLALSLRGKRAFPKAFIRGVSTAEESGQLDVELERWSIHYADETERSAKIFGDWVPKIIYFAILLLVGWQIYKMYVGIYGPVIEMMKGS